MPLKNISIVRLGSIYLVQDCTTGKTIQLRVDDPNTAAELARIRGEAESDRHPEPEPTDESEGDSCTT